MAANFITILAHRGLWQRPEEKNTPEAIARALTAGFGIETDIRDQDGELMIAHDVADPGAYPFSDLSSLFKKFPEACIALNVKSCGLQSLIADALREYGIRSYFTFDMALPDLIGNIKAELASFTRLSEFETEPVLYSKTQGVWMDMFERDWITADIIRSHTKADKDVALVSPELHKRPHQNFWQHLKDNETSLTERGVKNVYLCTDYPEEAAAYFSAR